jgi:hypothetical protein
VVTASGNDRAARPLRGMLRMRVAASARGPAGLAAIVVVSALLIGAVVVGAGTGPSAIDTGPSAALAWDIVVELLTGLAGGALVAAWIVTMVATLRRLRRAGSNPEWVPRRRRLPWWVRVLFSFVTILALVALWMARMRLNPPNTPAAPSAPPLHRLPPGAAHAAAGAPVALIAGAVLGALAVAAALAVPALLRRRGVAPGPALAAPEPEAEPVLAVDAALTVLDTEADPRRAVIAAYATMEEMLGRAGSPRRRSDAPADHIERSLVHLGAGRAAAGRLAQLFERARFSVHAIDEPLRRSAIDALAAVRDQLQPAGSER